MAGLIVPSSFTRQPQYPAPINKKIGAGLISCIGPWYRGDYIRDKPATLPSIVTTTQGKAYRTSSTATLDLSPSSYISIPAGSDFTLIIAFTVNLNGANPGLWRSAFDSQGNSFCLIQGSGSSRPWVRLNGTDILKPTTGPQLTSGAPIVMGVRVYNASRSDVWWSGIKQHTGSHAAATPSVSIYRIGTQWSTPLYESIGDIAGAWTWVRALDDTEMRQLTLNPWQMFYQSKRRFTSHTASSLSSYTINPSGFLDLSGVNPFEKTKIFLPSGNVSFSGASPVIKSKVMFISGSVALSGDNNLLKTKVLSPSGGLSFTGDTLPLKTKIIAPTGFLELSGTASLSGAMSYQINPVGSVDFSGTSKIIKTKVSLPTGLISFSGSSPMESNTVVVSTNTLITLTGVGK